MMMLTWQMQKAAKLVFFYFLGNSPCGWWCYWLFPRLEFPICSDPPFDSEHYRHPQFERILSAESISRRACFHFDKLDWPQAVAQVLERRSWPQWALNFCLHSWSWMLLSRSCNPNKGLQKKEHNTISVSCHRTSEETFKVKAKVGPSICHHVVDWLADYKSYQNYGLVLMMTC